MAVSAVGEGCLKQMRDMLEAVVDTILPFCQDQVIYFTIRGQINFNAKILFTIIGKTIQISHT